MTHSLPFVMDDISYAYFVTDSINGAPHNIDIERPIISVGDILESQWNHYLHDNGRFIVHFIVQGFCALWGKVAFDFFSTIIFGFSIIILSEICNVGNKDRLMIGILAISSIWLFSSDPTCLYRGVAYTTNYLWSMGITLLFVFIFIHSSGKGIFLIVFSFVSFVAGWSHESFSIGISSGLIAYSFYNREKMTYRHSLLLLSYSIGTSICVFAPSNFLRTGTYSDSTFMYSTKVLFEHEYIYYLIIIFCFLYLYFSKKEQIILIIKEDIIWISAIIISSMFIVATRTIGIERIYFALELFLIIECFRLVGRIFLNNDFFLKIPIVVCCLSIKFFIIPYQLKAGNQYKSINTQIENLGENNIIRVPFVIYPAFVQKYICRFYLSDHFNEEWIKENFEYKTYKCFSHSKKDLYFLDDGLYNYYKKKNVEALKMTGDNPFYLCDQWIVSESKTETVLTKYDFEGFNDRNVKGIGKHALSLFGAVNNKESLLVEHIFSPCVINGNLFYISPWNTNMSRCCNKLDVLNEK